MDTFSTIGVFVGAAIFLGLGIFALVMSIKGLASSSEPDITAGSSGGGVQVGRSGLFVFLILGIIGAIVGVALLIAGVRGVS